MTTSHKPLHHNAVSPYLQVSDGRRMLEFLITVFGATELFRQESPGGGIRHASVRIDDSVIMLGERPPGSASGINSIHVYVPDADQAYSRALEAGAVSIAAPKDQPYGDRSAGVQDQEGNIWWLGTHMSPLRNT